MAKELVTGAAVFLVGALIGAFVLTGSRGVLGSISAGGEVTNPVVFHDTAEFNGATQIDGELTLGNCGTRSSVIIPAISGLNTTSGDTAVATSVTVTGLAVGDVTMASWNPGHATGTLPEVGVTMTVNASTTNVAAITFQNFKFVTSTISQAAGTLTVCYAN